MYEIKTHDEYIAHVKHIHGGRYDYSKTRYTVGHAEITVTCHEHGDFTLTANAHLYSEGCPHCVRQGTYSFAEFLVNARLTHGFHYLYSAVGYKSLQSNVLITCLEHGDFIKTARVHVHGAGCPKCKRRLPPMYTEDFVEQARAVHGDTYDYSQSVYIGEKKELTIICRTHGAYKQRPLGHLRGVGCPNCTPNIDKL